MDRNLLTRAGRAAIGTQMLLDEHLATSTLPEGQVRQLVADFALRTAVDVRTSRSVAFAISFAPLDAGAFVRRRHESAHTSSLEAHIAQLPLASNPFDPSDR